MSVTERSFLRNPLRVRFRAIWGSPRLQPALSALLVSLGYYLGAQLGFALDFPGTPLSIFWPPNAILMAALILAPSRRWWLYLLAIFPAHLVVQWQNGVPIPTMLGWFVSNSSEAVIGAMGMHFFAGERPRLDDLRQAIVFLLSVVIVAPLLSSFLDAGVVVLTGRGSDYWYLWRVRILSNSLTNLTLVPVLLTWGASGAAWRRIRPRWRYIEAGVLALTLVIVSALAFGQLRADPSRLPALLYAPLPVLLWAAVRFGPIGASSGLVYVALVSTWNAANERGPFATLSTAENILSLRLFLIAVSVPIIFLAAVLKERQRAGAALQRSEAALKQSEERFRRAVLDAPIPIMIHAEDGDVLQLNHAWTELTGYDRSEITSIDEWTRRAYGARAVVARKAIKQLFEPSAIIPKQTNVVTTRRGGLRTWEFSSAPLGRAADGRRMIVSMAVDVTERKEAYQLLEQRVAERTAALAQANTELEDAKAWAEAANQAKSRFLATISHELRTPLNVILGFAQIMARSRDLPSKQREHLATIQRSGKHLLSLINSVLDLAKIESGRATLNETTVDLVALSDDLELLFRQQAAEKGLDLRVERATTVPRYVHADALKLRQVLVNLLGNAVKFTETGRVTLRVGSADCRLQMADWADHSAIVFEVEDTGPGIALEEQEHIFEPFVQTTAGVQTHRGTGLGLAISHQYVQLMGGALQVHSAPGHGARFTATIPLQVAAHATSEMRRDSPHVVALAPDQPPSRILVVDDEEDNRQLLITLLAPLGFELREAENGEEAVALARDWQPQLILLDLRIPLLDGYQAVPQIKASAIGRPPVIIAVSASSSEDERAAVLAAGCDDFIRKPFRDSEIFTSLARHLGVHYIYADESQAVAARPSSPLPAHVELDAEALAALPAHVLNELERSIVDANPLLIGQSVAVVRTHNAALADLLAARADRFEHARILACIEAARGLHG